MTICKIICEMKKWCSPYWIACHWTFLNCTLSQIWMKWVSSFLLYLSHFLLHFFLLNCFDLLIYCGIISTTVTKTCFIIFQLYQKRYKLIWWSCCRFLHCAWRSSSSQTCSWSSEEPRPCRCIQRSQLQLTLLPHSLHQRQGYYSSLITSLLQVLSQHSCH